MNRQVLPLHITIGPRLTSGAYAVRATADQAEVWTELALPQPLPAFVDRLLCAATTLPLREPLVVGRALGRALFEPPLRDLLLRSARAALRADRRLQIQLQIGAPELAALPWEWLTIGAEKTWSPGLRADYALVRVSRPARPIAPAAIAGPLRILAIAAAGEELQLEALEAALRSAVHAGRIDLQLLYDVTPDTLETALASGTAHILHCAAEINVTARGNPRLLIGRGLGAFDLAELLAETPRLRLVTLTGPQGDGNSAAPAVPLLATTLLSSDLPATIAFGAPLPALLAARFAAVCYARLAAGAPVDLAVTAGRCALATRAEGRCWGSPQLRMLSGSERLFAISRARGQLSYRPALLPALAALLIALLIVGRSVGARGDGLGAAQVEQRAGSGAPATTRLAVVGAPSVEAAAPTITPTPVATPQPTDAPTALPQPTDAPTTLPQPTGYATYLTADGDTLESIAARMGSDPAAIAALNRVEPQAALRPARPLVIPVFRPGADSAGGLIIPRGNPAEPKVALTFDIEIDDTTLYAILDILRPRGLHGTFFVTGSWVRRYPDAARAIVNEGHEIGNHSLTHPFFSRIGLDGVSAELEKTEQLVKETTGASTHPYFRFPYGDATAQSSAIVAREGYVAYHWSADDPAIPSWLARAAQQPAAAYGGILLMHERASTVAALPGWLDRLAAIGLHPTTLGEVLR